MRALRDPRAYRRGRHGGGLPRPRQAEARRCAESVTRRLRARSRTHGSLPREAEMLAALNELRLPATEKAWHGEPATSTSSGPSARARSMKSPAVTSPKLGTSGWRSEISARQNGSTSAHHRKSISGNAVSGAQIPENIVAPRISTSRSPPAARTASPPSAAPAPPPDPLRLTPRHPSDPATAGPDPAPIRTSAAPAPAAGPRDAPGLAHRAPPPVPPAPPCRGQPAPREMPPPAPLRGYLLRPGWKPHFQMVVLDRECILATRKQST